VELLGGFLETPCLSLGFRGVGNRVRSALGSARALRR